MRKSYMIERLNRDGHKVFHVSNLTIRVMYKNKDIYGKVSSVFKKIYSYK